MFRLLLLFFLPAFVDALRCLNGFQARIDGLTEFEMVKIVNCPPHSKYCVSGLNNMVKHVFLVGFTELRVWGCEGTKAKYTTDIMPKCNSEGWMYFFDHLRHCCIGEECNTFTGADPPGLSEFKQKVNFGDDFRKYRI